MTSQANPSQSNHYVIIGSGVAGNQAAMVLRERETDSRITILTNNRLLFYNRYLLPSLFLGEQDWRRLLAHPPAYYTEQRITVRRDSWVSRIDAAQHLILLRHNETVHYDKLLVASGARGYLPEDLADSRSMIQDFGSYEQAIAMQRALPAGGRVIMLGGDMIGLDLARSLINAGYRVTMITGEFTFWPHQVPDHRRAEFLAALTHMGLELIDGEAQGGVQSVETGANGTPPSARCVLFRDGSGIYGDVVMSFMGLLPSVEFMLGSGIDIERGLLVNTGLQSSDPDIYAAGDVCQIWSPEEQRYRFYYGYQHVKAMGAIAAINMTGGNEPFVSTRDESLRLNALGQVESPFWEYE